MDGLYVDTHFNRKSSSAGSGAGNGLLGKITRAFTSGRSGGARYSQVGATLDDDTDALLWDEEQDDSADLAESVQQP